jgi:hypothetical protein
VPVQFVSPPSARSDDHDADDSPSKPHHYRMVSDLLGEPAGPSQPVDEPQPMEDMPDDKVLHLAV